MLSFQKYTHAYKKIDVTGTLKEYCNILLGVRAGVIVLCVCVEGCDDVMADEIH